VCGRAIAGQSGIFGIGEQVTKAEREIGYDRGGGGRDGAFEPECDCVRKIHSAND
jgi:hypothetical protein